MKQRIKKDQDEADADSSVMAGGFRGAITKRRRKKLVAVVIVAVIIVIGVWVYMVIRSLNPAVTEGEGFDVSRISGDYQTMTDPEIRYLLKKKTGLDTDIIRHRAIARNEVGDFKAAREVADAMAGLEERQRSYEAYEIAESMLDTRDLPAVIGFYDDFARLCLEKGDVGAVKRVATRAMGLIADSTLSATEKTNEKAKFEELIWLSEQ